MIHFGRFQLDPVQGLRTGTGEVRITPKSLSLLCMLASRAGQVVSKEEIFQKVWPDTTVSDSALTSCIQELRGALHDNVREPKFIETVHRRGYRFAASIFHEDKGGPWIPEDYRPRCFANRHRCEQETIGESLGACPLARR